MLPSALKPFKPLKVSTSIVDLVKLSFHIHTTQKQEMRESLLPIFTTEREADSHL